MIDLEGQETVPPANAESQPATAPTELAAPVAPEDRLDSLIVAVLASDVPEYKLFDELMVLRAQQELQLMVDLFESMIWRIPIKSINPYRTMVDVYLLLRRTESAFAMVAFVTQLERGLRETQEMYIRVFEILMRQDRPRLAFDVLVRHHEMFPDDMPLAPAHEALRCARAARRELPPALRSGDDRLPPANSVRIPVVPARVREPFNPMILGAARVPPFLSYAMHGGTRGPIDVVRIENGRLLIQKETVAVLDSAGEVSFGLSTCDYPGMVRQFFERRGKVPPREIHEAETAVLIGDRFCSGGNLCHFLLDHVTRLWLYREAGVDLSTALVVGAPRRLPFEFEALERLGIRHYVAADRDVEVRATQLHVATTCRTFDHAADAGSAWAIDFLRDAFLPAGVSPSARIYISRRAAYGRRVHNEAAVEALLHDRGFVTIAAEEMAWADQVRLFAGATHIVGAHGAGLANAIFAQPGCRVLEIFHPLYGTPAYARLTQAAKWEYTGMMARDWQSDAPEFNDPFLPGWQQPAFGNRDMRVDLGELECWVDEIG